MNVRRFLNDIDAEYDGGAFIIARIQQDTEFNCTDVLLKIADCDRNISLDFNIEDAYTEKSKEGVIKNNKKKVEKAYLIANTLMEFAQAYDREVIRCNLEIAKADFYKGEVK